MPAIKIIKKIEGASIADRIKIEKSFRNIKINWFLNFVRIHDKKSPFDKRYVIMRSFDFDHNRDIYYKVEYDEFPELGVSEIDSQYGIIGVITKVENLIIFVKPIKIKQSQMFST